MNELTKSNGIVKHEMDNVEKNLALGKIFADSGVFPDIKSAAQGYVKILAGKELGLSPMQAINSFYFVAGRLGIVAQTMGAMVKKSGKYDYKITKHSDQECEIAFIKIGKEGEETEIGNSHFDIKMAAKAGLVNKNNWKDYPMNMLFARALMNGIRWYCPDAVSAFTYSVEELEDLSVNNKPSIITIDDTGEVKNGEERLPE